MNCPRCQTPAAKVAATGETVHIATGRTTCDDVHVMIADARRDLPAKLAGQRSTPTTTAQCGCSVSPTEYGADLRPLVVRPCVEHGPLANGTRVAAFTPNHGTVLATVVSAIVVGVQFPGFVYTVRLDHDGSTLSLAAAFVTPEQFA